jgi:hypothetical protein
MIHSTENSTNDPLIQVVLTDSVLVLLIGNTTGMNRLEKSGGVP